MELTLSLIDAAPVVPSAAPASDKKDIKLSIPEHPTQYVQAKIYVHAHC